MSTQQKNMKDEVLSIMKLIAEKELDKEASSLQQATYNDQRTLINAIFSGKEYTEGNVMLRLVVIDSLYSTNAAYCYFSFEEMAEKISSLGSEKEARDYFYKVTTTGEDRKKLFCEPYGIRKNLGEGSMQMSLLSKYAYYCLLQEPSKYPLGFPIYDRLAKEAYPTVCKMLGISKIHSLPVLETPSIDKYIDCIGQLRKELFGDNNKLFCGYQQHDILDAYLWRMGKFEDGNLSLLVGWKDYERFVKNLGLEVLKNEDDSAYRKRMVEKYAGTSAVSKDSKFDFAKAVVIELEKGKQLFRGISVEKYLTELLDHWRIFHEIKKNKK